jgi:hypothetical protein
MFFQAFYTFYLPLHHKKGKRVSSTLKNVWTIFRRPVHFSDLTDAETGRSWFRSAQRLVIGQPATALFLSRLSWGLVLDLVYTGALRSAARSNRVVDWARWSEF